MSTQINNFHAFRVEANLVIDTSAYGNGDLLSDRVALRVADTLGPRGKIRGEILSLTLLDKDDEGGLCELVVLDSDVTLGTINDAPTLSDTNAERVIAVVPVAAADYYDLGSCKVARPGFDPIPFEISTVNLYIAAISRDTKTYSAASDLRVKAFIRLHNVCL